MVYNIREPEMFVPMTRYLESQGYNILSQKGGRESGLDIIAKHGGRQLIMEMKGDNAALDVDLGTGILQLFRSIEDENQDYALGLSEAYVNHIRKAEYPLRKLNIKAFIIIQDNGKTYQFW